MPVNIPRGTTDPVLNEIRNLFDQYQADHPRAQIDLYRQNPVSVRVRIIDPDFEKMRPAERNDQVWDYLDRLPEEVATDVTVLVLLTPAEAPKSYANMDFDDPVASVI